MSLQIFIFLQPQDKDEELKKMDQLPEKQTKLLKFSTISILTFFWHEIWRSSSI